MMAVGDMCPVCKREIEEGQILQAVNVDGGRGEQEAHIVCSFQYQLGVMQTLLVGVVHQLGGFVTVEEASIDAGVLASGGVLTIRPDRQTKSVSVELGDHTKPALVVP